MATRTITCLGCGKQREIPSHLPFSRDMYEVCEKCKSKGIKESDFKIVIWDPLDELGFPWN